MKHFLIALLFALPLCAQPNGPVSGPTAWKYNSDGSISPVGSGTTVKITGTVLRGGGTSLPAACAVGDQYFLTAGTTGLYACTATNTWTLPSSAPTCPVGTWSYGACEVKTTIPYTDSIFTAASTTADKTLFQLPAAAKVVGWTIYHTAAFAGTGVTSTTAGIGCSTDPEFYAPAANIFQAAATTTFSDGGGHASCDMAAHNVVARVSANTNFGVGGVTVLSAGSVTLWVRYIPLT